MKGVIVCYGRWGKKCMIQDDMRLSAFNKLRYVPRKVLSKTKTPGLFFFFFPSTV